MTVHAGHEGPGPSRAATGAELIVSAQQATMKAEAALNALVRALERHNRPAQMREVGFTVDKPKCRVEAGDTALSVGVYNPSGATIYTDVNGGAPEPGRDALRILPRSLLVLPVSSTDLQLGVDPADPAVVAGECTVFVLRFDTVQPAFLGSA